MGFIRYLAKLVRSAFGTITGWISVIATLIGYCWPLVMTTFGFDWELALTTQGTIAVRLVLIAAFPIIMLWEAYQLHVTETDKNAPNKKLARVSEGLALASKIHARGVKVDSAYATNHDSRDKYAAEMLTLAVEARTVIAEYFPDDLARFDAIELEPQRDHAAQLRFKRQMGALNGIINVGHQRRNATPY